MSIYRFDLPMAEARGMVMLVVVTLIICAGKKHELGLNCVLNSPGAVKHAVTMFCADVLQCYNVLGYM